MPLTDEEKQRIREEELVRLQARDEYQGRNRNRTIAPVAMGLSVFVVAALMIAFNLLRTV